MLEELLARCAPADWLPGLVGAAGIFGVPGTLLIAGLIGGAFHCVGMCGPFVLAQTTRGPTLRRLDARWLAPYHLGRIVAYAGLGALAGGTSGAFAGVTGLKLVAAALLALGGAYFALQGAAGLGWIRLGSSAGWGAAWGRVIGGIAAPLLRAQSRFSGFALGLVLGLLPCGLLWGALAVAGGTGRAFAGALAMAGFAVGTVPALGAVAWAGGAANDRFRDWAARVAPPLLLLNAGFLFYFAWRAAG